MEENKSFFTLFDWGMIWSLTLTVLKVTDAIDVPWWKIFSPIWVLFVVAVIVGIINVIGGK